MNSRLKRRLVAVTGVIVIVVIVVLAIVFGTTAKGITVAQAVSGDFIGVKVEVNGKVVDNSYSLDGNVLSFLIYADSDDTDGASAAARPQLKVTYDQGVSATFGNQIEAICTGTIDESGVLVCTTLVTKCPSKYESSTDALSVSQLLSYGERMVGTVVKVTGAVQAGTLRSAAEQQDRFVLTGTDNAGVAGGGGPLELPVAYGGALSDEVRDGSEVVLTGKLNDKGQFEAADVALRG